MIRQKSFTLIELLVVIAIVGLISSAIFASLNTGRAKGRDSQRVQDLNTLRTAFELYYNDNNQYPSTAGKIGKDETDSINTEISPYLTSIPTDPINDATHFYYYDPSHICISAETNESTVVYAKTMEESKNSQYTDTCDNVGVGATDPIAETRVVFITASNTLASGPEGPSGGTDYTNDAALVAWWNLDEPSGQRAMSGGTCANCTLADINTVYSDTLNKAEGIASASFSASSNEYLSATDSELKIGAADITWGCWVRRTQDTNWLTIFGIKNEMFPVIGYRSYVDTGSNNRLLCSVGGTMPSRIAYSTIGSIPSDDTFVHAVCQLDDDPFNMQAFINGSSSGSPSTANITWLNSGEMRLGNSSNWSHYDGEMDECFVFSRTLSNAEICDICKYGITGNEDRTSICNC